MLIYAKEHTIYIPKHLTIDNCEVVEKHIGKKKQQQKRIKTLTLGGSLLLFPDSEFSSAFSFIGVCTVIPG